jgi:uncharacterized protein YkwD
MRRKSYVLIVFAAFFAALAVAPAALAAQRGGAALTLLRAMNAARASYGLRPFRVDSRLRVAAQSHSTDMLRRNYFAHGDFPGRMAAFHIQAPAAGENLAWGSGAYGTAQTIVQEWLASPEHRANLLRPGFTRIGIGIARGTFLGNGGASVVTADFAGR